MAVAEAIPVRDINWLTLPGNVEPLSVIVYKGLLLNGYQYVLVFVVGRVASVDGVMAVAVPALSYTTIPFEVARNTALAEPHGKDVFSPLLESVVKATLVTTFADWSNDVCRANRMVAVKVASINATTALAVVSVLKHLADIPLVPPVVVV
jgi:hypothetical protein